MFEWINVFFMNALNWIYGWVGNYGWAVVIFTLLTRLVLMPLDVKSAAACAPPPAFSPRFRRFRRSTPTTRTSSIRR